MPVIKIRLTFVFAGLIAAFIACGACAALNCEQLIAISQTTIELRDQGYSLNRVLAQVENDSAREKLDAQEINLLRQIVRVSFTSEYSPREILEACQAGNLGIPKPKPKP